MAQAAKGLRPWPSMVQRPPKRKKKLRQLANSVVLKKMTFILGSSSPKNSLDRAIISMRYKNIRF
ncbi:MAG: hypothetical protein N2Z70_01460, partial [Bdellovibrionaceae bacterium]|nr:hypothetical protein [Pseudobdellovibrionaceae bacterium]